MRFLRDVRICDRITGDLISPRFRAQHAWAEAYAWKSQADLPVSARNHILINPRRSKCADSSSAACGSRGSVEFDVKSGGNARTCAEDNCS